MNESGESASSSTSVECWWYRPSTQCWWRLIVPSEGDSSPAKTTRRIRQPALVLLLLLVLMVLVMMALVLMALALVLVLVLVRVRVLVLVAATP